MPTFIKIAQHKSSEEQSARELLIRGSNLFGSSEAEKTASANFFVILLDCIEKWSIITSEFSDWYKLLIDLGITFPSSFKEAVPIKRNLSKKSVSFCMSSAVKSESQITIISINDSKKKEIDEIKAKMLSVKATAKRCKKFLKKNQNQAEP